MSLVVLRSAGPTKPSERTMRITSGFGGPAASEASGSSAGPFEPRAGREWGIIPR